MDVVHSTDFVEQRTRLIDDHGVDVKPLPIPDRWLEIVVGLRCYKTDDAELNNCRGYNSGANGITERALKLFLRSWQRSLINLLGLLQFSRT